MHDIRDRKDIEELVRSFYKELLKLEEMEAAFAGLDFEKHIPGIVSFWAFVLLDESGYKTNVFEKHRGLLIKPEHFDTWLEVWTETVKSQFSGEKADLAIQRATVVAYTFKSRWPTDG